MKHLTWRESKRGSAAAEVPRTPPLRGGLHWEGPPQSQLAALKWMMQKALLRQDMFLLGPPGTLLRHTALRFCELLGREALKSCSASLA